MTAHPSCSCLARAPLVVAAMLGLAMSLAISGCGSDDETRSTTTPQASQAQKQGGAADTAATPSVDEDTGRPGCGELCQHAGPPAGTDEPGCPDDDSDKCEPCPKEGCAELLTRRVRVHDDLITVTMRCNVDHACSGAFHVYLPGTLSGRLAASDVSVPPNELADVDVALTTLGRRVVAYQGDYLGHVYVFLKGTGIDELGRSGFSPPELSMSSPHAQLVPCGENIAAAENTSCPFAENVFAAFSADPTSEGILTVKSPTTGQSYRMTCYSDAKTVYCAGGNDAFLAFPQPTDLY